MYVSQPVIVTAFNRPGHLENLLNFLISQNRTILVSLDRAAPSDEKNYNKNLECIKILEEKNSFLKSVRIAHEPQGCFKGVSKGITWAFSIYECLIILEDDILPSVEFLEFQDEMLSRFENQKEIGSIAGTNIVPAYAQSSPKKPYRYSVYTSSWGWGTWRDRWDSYITDLAEFPNNWESEITSTLSSATVKYWKNIFQEVHESKIDSWAYRWLYSNMKNSRLQIIPNVNLALNNGFTPEATHTTDSIPPFWLPVATGPKPKNLEVSIRKHVDAKADTWMEKNHFRTGRMQEFRKNTYKRYPLLLKVRKKIRITATRKGGI
jgi:hypothetical protein